MDVDDFPGIPGLVGSWELDVLSGPEQCFALAQAYLSAATLLCGAMVQGTTPNSYAHGQVVFALTHHSLELFLKGAIHGGTNRPAPAHHDIFELHKTYQITFPKDEFTFHMPFGPVDFGGYFSEEQKRELQKEWGRTQNEQYRYPYDKKGNRWGGVFGFQASAFLLSLEALARGYGELVPRIVAALQSDRRGQQSAPADLRNASRPQPR